MGEKDSEQIRNCLTCGEGVCALEKSKQEREPLSVGVPLVNRWSGRLH